MAANDCTAAGTVLVARTNLCQSRDVVMLIGEFVRKFAFLSKWPSEAIPTVAPPQRVTRSVRGLKARQFGRVMRERPDR